MEDVQPSGASPAVSRRASTWLRRAIHELRELREGPELEPAHVARIDRVYRVAVPLYGLLALATAGNRFSSDPIMAGLWMLQAGIALVTSAALFMRPKRADHVMRVGFGLLSLGMLARIPRAVLSSGLRDVDLHSATVGLVLALLVAQTLFAPKAAKRVSFACASLTFVIMIGSFACLKHPSFELCISALRLLATTALLVALLSFVSDSAREYARLREEHRLMQNLALCDALTELPNRRACEASLRRELARGARDGRPLSVAILDVDHFKGINDRFGHDVGDRVLIGVAQVLRESLRASDEPARWAGDEFVTVLPGTGLEQAQLVAERIRRAVSNARFADTPAEITVTLGVAQLVPGEDVQSLLARADRNLYRAKRDGRNCSVAA